MKALYKSDEDYIPLPSNDPFVNSNRGMLERMGYTEKEIEIESEKEIEDAVSDDEEETSDGTSEETNKEKTYVTSDGTVYTESELKEILNKI